jgi:hypothetical protein
MQINGQCACGNVTFRVDGEPDWFRPTMHVQWQDRSIELRDELPKYLDYPRSWAAAARWQSANARERRQHRDPRRGVVAMSTFAILIIVCGGSAVLALALSISARWRIARRVAQGSLWLTLAGVPLVLAIDITRMWLDAGSGASSALVLGKTISQAMSYGAVALPCAVIAGMALRRVNAHGLRAGPTRSAGTRGRDRW